MMNKILTRLKNKKVALAVISGILLTLVNLGLIDNSMSERLNELLTTLLTVGVAVGIFSDPESHINKDDEN